MTETAEMTGTSIRTFTGKLVDLANVLPSDIDIHDIAHALSRICRFGGHTTWPYWVSQHCCQVARRVPRELALEGMLHDAAEAYIGDVTRPLKKLLGATLKKIETQIECAIALQFGLIYPWPAEIKAADNECLRNEQITFWPGTTDSETGELRDPKLLRSSDRLNRLMPDDAERLFLAIYREYERDRSERARTKAAG